MSIGTNGKENAETSVREMKEWLDNNGRENEVARGIYFYKIEDPGGQQMLKLEA